MRVGNDDFVPVILGTSMNAYNVARSLHEAFGVRSLALGRVAVRETADSAIVSVRAYREFNDPGFVVETLRALAGEFPGVPLVLIPTIEYYTNVVIDHRGELDDHFLLPLVGKQLADQLMDKSAFYRTCAQLGVPHPRTVVLAPGEPLSSPAEDGLPFSYPVILKPSDTDAYPRLRFAGKQKVYRANDAAELAAFVALVREGGYRGDLIIQELIAGDESVMRVVNTYSDRHGRMVFASVGQIALADPDPQYLGNYHAIVTVPDPELVEVIRHFLDELGYVGAANFDVMVDRRDGTSKLLEINLRQGGASFSTMVAGGNLARCYVDDLVYHADIAPQITTAQRLWLNVPYPVVLRYAPRSLRPLIRSAARHGKQDTYSYRADRGLRRRIDVLRMKARTTLAYLRFGRRYLPS